jgi:hypothetical protein
MTKDRLGGLARFSTEKVTTFNIEWSESSQSAGWKPQEVEFGVRSAMAMGESYITLH